MFRKINWKVGNSTIRDLGKVLVAFLIYANMFNLKKYDAKTFIRGLNEHPMFSYKSKSSSIQAGFIRSMLRELGLVTTSEGVEKVTPIGNKLLRNPSKFSEVLIQQLSTLQFNNGKEIIKPFVIFAMFMREMSKRGIDFITKDEFNLFIITCMNTNHIKEHVDKLIRYRSLKDNKTKNKYKNMSISLAVRNAYKEDLKRKEETLLSILLDNTAENLIENSHLLDELFATKKGKNLSKKALKCKEDIINTYCETRSVKEAIEVFNSYYVGIKRSNLQSDAGITINYFKETGFLAHENGVIKLNYKYLPLISYVVEKENVITRDYKEYTKQHCFSTNILLTARIKQVNTITNVSSAIGTIRSKISQLASKRFRILGKEVNSVETAELSS